MTTQTVPLIGTGTTDDPYRPDIDTDGWRVETVNDDGTVTVFLDPVSALEAASGTGGGSGESGIAARLDDFARRITDLESA